MVTRSVRSLRGTLIAVSMLAAPAAVRTAQADGIQGLAVPTTALNGGTLASGNAFRSSLLGTANTAASATLMGGRQNDLQRLADNNDIRLRLGLMFTPRTKFTGGVDYTFRRLIPGFTSSRIDLEAIVSANFGGLTTIVPLTIDQVYGHTLANGYRLYIGAGVGPYFGEVTRFGGKIFVGANFTPRISGEVAVHFAGSGDALGTASIRIKL